MTRTKHPSNRYQRKKIAEKKHKFVEEKKGKIKAERPAKVWHKLTIEQLKERETQDALREAFVDISGHAAEQPLGTS